MLKEKQEKVKKVIVKFRGIDSWNRPVFKDIDSKSYFGSCFKLFDFGTPEEEVIEFFKDNLNSLCYFGTSFDCEPLGIPLNSADLEKPIQLELYKEEEEEEESYFTNIFGEKFKRNPNFIDIELLSSEIKAIKKLIEDYCSNYATQDEKLFLFYPILARLEKSLSEENREKSYKKSLIDKGE